MIVNLNYQILHNLYMWLRISKIMELKLIKDKIPEELYEILGKEITQLRPSQEKSIKKGLLDGKNLLVCTPTASGRL